MSRWTPEARQRQSVIMKEYFENPAFKMRCIGGLTTWTPERRAAQSHRLKEKRLTPVFDQKQRVVMERLNHNPEFRAKQLAALPRVWKLNAEREADPEYRAQKFPQRHAHALKNVREMSHKRPTWPEVRFYGLIFGEPITARGFTAQQSDGHGIYDGAWRDRHLIVELDGGGHHLFRDRHAEDTKKDIMRMLDGNTIIREEDENRLFLKALAILASEC